MIRNPFRDLDQKKLSRSSDVLKTQNDYFKIVNRRIFIFGIIICLIFAVVSVRLVFLQIRNQEDYAAKLENYSSQKQTDSTARGEMVDRNGKFPLIILSTFLPRIQQVRNNGSWHKPLPRILR